MNWKALLLALLAIPAVIAVMLALLMVIRLLFLLSPIIVPALALTGVIWWLYIEIDKLDEKEDSDGKSE